jgi:hypothetical protein
MNCLGLLRIVRERVMRVECVAGRVMQSSTAHILSLDRLITRLTHRVVATTCDDDADDVRRQTLSSNAQFTANMAICT